MLLRLALIAPLMLAIAKPVDSGMSPQFGPVVSGQIRDFLPGIIPQLWLERDGSRGWQQFIDSTAPTPDGAFSLRVHEPGIYWILAREGVGRSTRRGACMVDVHDDGVVRWRAVPAGWPGKKWGGAATTICIQRTLLLLPSRLGPRRVSRRHVAQGTIKRPVRH
jgi:hypothetical protein